MNRRHFAFLTTLLVSSALAAYKSNTSLASAAAGAAPSDIFRVSTSVPQPASPMYAGTYAVKDITICPLSIAVTQQGSHYTYIYQGTRGRVKVVNDGTETYFTFIGLKGQEPEEDITAAWQDSVLLIQNYGNSMNEYTRFSNCDAKYLELHRQ